MKRLRPISTLVACLWVCTVSHAADIVIFQALNDQRTEEFDGPLGEFIESLGHNVTFLDSSEGEDAQLEAAEENDLVYVTESLGSGTLHDGVETFLKGVATPVIHAEAYAWDEAAMTGDIQFEDFGNTQRANPDEDPSNDTVDGQTELFIIDPTHPLAAGFTGEVQVYEDPYSLNWGLTSTLGPGAEVVAAVDAAGEFATIFSYEPGAELEDGTQAAGRRIGFHLAQGGDGNILWDNIHDNSRTLLEAAINFGITGARGELAPQLQAGDADQDLDFDQLDLVRVQIAGKYLTGAAATWGEGDWNGAPGGEQGSPPAGDGVFNQLDIIGALGPGLYLTGPYAAINAGGVEQDGQTSIVYDPGTGHVSVDAPAGMELTSINIDSAAGIFTGAAAENLGGSFDNDADANIFKATFGGSFGSIGFGNVAQSGLAEDFLLGDLTVVGSVAGGGELGQVDLIYVPEPSALLLVTVGMMGVLAVRRER